MAESKINQWNIHLSGNILTGFRFKMNKMLKGEKCRRRDLNPHTRRHTPLKRARLPISPLRQEMEMQM